MSKIIEQLEKNKEKRLFDETDVSRDVKLLLEGRAAGEIQVLKEIGLDDQIKQAEKKQELSILDKTYSEKYKGKVFHISELADIGIKYRLFLKRADLYRGTIPPDLGAIVLALKEKHNLNINTSYNSDKGSFVIMAPPVMFKDYNSIGDKIVAHYKDEEADRKKLRIQRIEADPLLFFRIDNEHFLLLKKWGADLTITRRIKGFFTATYHMTTLVVLTLCFFLVQLPFRAWRWADLWVTQKLNPKWTGANVYINGVENGAAWQWSHILVFAVALLITIILMISIINAARETKDRSWRWDYFHTKGFYKRRFSI